MTFLPILLLIAVVILAMGRVSSNPSRRFAQLGNMRGKSKYEIIEAVGPPSSVSQGAGYTLLQWQTRGYHVALKFDDEGMFAGVVHEYAGRR